MPLDLTAKANLIPLLQKHGLYTQKRLGQHFLVDQSVITASLAAANVQSADTIVEVGAGTGVLTIALARTARQVISYEIDPLLQPLLSETLSGFSNIDLRIGDFLHDPNAMPAEPYKFIANLPYNVGSHIIHRLITSHHQPISITVLLQREVANKIVAQPPRATYLSNFIGTYGQARIISAIQPGSFFPPPKVESALLHITANPPGQQVAALDANRFSRFLHRGFASPRKMINKAFSPAELAQARIDGSQRPENLQLGEWLQLYQVLEGKRS